MVSRVSERVQKGRESKLVRKVKQGDIGAKRVKDGERKGERVREYGRREGGREGERKGKMGREEQRTLTLATPHSTRHPAVLPQYPR